MKIAFCTAVAAIALTAISSVAMAEQSNKYPPIFGPVLEAQMQGHTMQYQAIKDKTGTYIVLSRADAEKLLGHKMEDSVFFEMQGH